MTPPRHPFFSSHNLSTIVYIIELADITSAKWDRTIRTMDAPESQNGPLKPPFEICFSLFNEHADLRFLSIAKIVAKMKVASNPSSSRNVRIMFL